ncbi:MAG: DUF192 domain-containing protein [Pseudomonadota bacterium]|nr:DUF192 domain-containing protein [Pseudomonadota bacterium]
MTTPTPSTTTIKIREAANFKERLCGLITLKLNPQEGLLFRNANSLHTWFMKYPIDIIYLDNEGRILKIVPNLKPWRFSLCLKAKHFLEVPSHEQHGFRVNDLIQLP